MKTTTTSWCGISLVCGIRLDSFCLKRLKEQFWDYVNQFFTGMLSSLLWKFTYLHSIIVPSRTWILPILFLMVDQHRRWWANINTTLGQLLELAGRLLFFTQIRDCCIRLEWVYGENTTLQRIQLTLKPYVIFIVQFLFIWRWSYKIAIKEFFIHIW